MKQGGRVKKKTGKKEIWRKFRGNLGKSDKIRDLICDLQKFVFSKLSPGIFSDFLNFCCLELV